MAVKISSYLLNAGRDDDRISGLKPPATGNFFGGMVITQDPASGPAGAGENFKAFNGTAVVSATNPFPWGLVIENSHAFVGGFLSTESQQGFGFDTNNFAWGGLFSAFHRPGNLLDVFDDLADTTQVTPTGGTLQNASAPFFTGDTWTVGAPIYASAQGLLTTSVVAPTGGVIIGWVRAVFGSGASLIIGMELNMFVFGGTL